MTLMKWSVRLKIAKIVEAISIKNVEFKNENIIVLMVPFRIPSGEEC